MDANQLVGEQLGVTRTAEFFVIDPDLEDHLPRPAGRPPDYGTQKADASHTWAADAIDATLAGRPVMAASDEPGCLVDFPERGKCHADLLRPASRRSSRRSASPAIDGGIGPFAMTELRDGQGFSPMIREVLRTDRMPPWNVDPHVGKWDGDKSLTADEIKTLVHWVEAGAPRGDGPDPLAQLASSGRVAAGQAGPDPRIPAYNVPASGVVDYQRPVVLNPLDRRQVGQGLASGATRQACTTSCPATRRTTTARQRADAGRLQRLRGRRRSHPVADEPASIPRAAPSASRPTTRRSARKRRTSRSASTSTRTREARGMCATRWWWTTHPHPAGAARHKETAYIELPKDALLYSAFPHAHYRGSRLGPVLQLPGRQEEGAAGDAALRLQLAARVHLRRAGEGSGGLRIFTAPVRQLQAEPGQPDPTRTIPSGDQSWEEMFYTAIRFRWLDETAAAPTHDPALARLRLLYGYADRDMDGRLALGEMPEQTRKRFEADFDRADSDGDGVISVPEFREFTRPGPRSGDDDVGASTEP